MEEPNFSVLAYMQRRFDAVGRKNAFKATTREEYAAWKKETTAELKRLIGYDTMQPADPKAHLTPPQNKGQYSLQHLVLQTEPGIWMPVLVLKPHGTGPFIPVIATHGHGGNGKGVVAGEPASPEEAQAIKEFNYDYARQLCLAGFLVFAPDARGFGERREANDGEGPMGCSCRVLNNMAIPLGQTVTGMWTWDLHRLVDYIETRRDCRVDRLAIVGLSGGGHQALWAAALDERITHTVVSGYFYGYKESLLEMNQNCSCNYVPHLWEHVDMGDIGALIAPRPLQVETGDVDSLNGKNGVENVKAQLAITRRAYELLGHPENLKHSVQHGPHKWYGVGVIDWLK